MDDVNQDILAERRDEIFTEFMRAWEYACYLLDMDGPFPIVWRMKESDNLPANNNKRNPWVRVQFRHNAGRATSISKRRYLNSGVFTIECFVGQNTTDSGAKVELLGRTLVDYFRRYIGKIDLKNIRLVTASPVGGFSKVNVLADFTYPEFHPRDNNVNSVVIDDAILDDALQRLTDDNGEAYRV